MNTVSVYRLPEIYDVAFSYRNIGAEVDVLSVWYAKHSGRDLPMRILELAAGPAEHAIEFARRGSEAVALDHSVSMCEYAHMRARLAGVKLETIECDMRSFQFGERFDFVVCMLDSTSHLLSLDDMVQCLASIASALADDGVVIFEMGHPAEWITGQSRTLCEWEREREGLRVKTLWGTENDHFDPTTQIVNTNVTFDVKAANQELVQHSFTLTLRRWTACELVAAARLAGLECVVIYGALKANVPFTSNKESWRMIPVLQHAKAGVAARA